MFQEFFFAFVVVLATAAVMKMVNKTLPRKPPLVRHHAGGQDRKPVGEIQEPLIWARVKGVDVLPPLDPELVRLHEERTSKSASLNFDLTGVNILPSLPPLPPRPKTVAKAPVVDRTIGYIERLPIKVYTTVTFLPEMGDSSPEEVAAFAESTIQSVGDSMKYPVYGKIFSEYKEIEFCSSLEKVGWKLNVKVKIHNQFSESMNFSFTFQFCWNEKRDRIFGVFRRMSGDTVAFNVYYRAVVVRLKEQGLLIPKEEI